MKKIIFTLLALVGTMSMNAQVMKIYNGDQLVAKYKSNQATHVVFEEETAITGKAMATIGGSQVEVNWVQLWEDGPRFAEYNVGAANNKAEDYGGYYCWGKSADKDANGVYKEGDSALTGEYDTATNLWGNNWRMPTKAEFEALLANCDAQWTNVNGVHGHLFTGKGDYSSNSVFLPAAGYCGLGSVRDQGDYGHYWSSAPRGSFDAYCLRFDSGDQYEGSSSRDNGYSVRAVLAED